MALDDYVTLGQSGLRVSPFCLGAMTFGEDWGWGASVAESEAVIARFLERGGNFIDTANEPTFAIIDELTRIARDRESTPAAVALAWVQGRPGGRLVHARGRHSEQRVLAVVADGAADRRRTLLRARR